MEHFLSFWRPDWWQRK